VGLAGLLALIAASVLGWFLTHRAPPQPSAELTEKRLTFNSSENPVRSNGISPDGKYLSYSDLAGIHVRLLATGEERLVPRPGGVPAAALWFNQYWFPDSTQFIANVLDAGGHGSIWTVSLLGQSPRELREDATGGAVSPDGRWVAYWGPTLASGTSREIWVMGSQGDNPRKVVILGEGEVFAQGMWSPDGQRLAYIRVRQGPEGDQASIETCDLKGSRTVVVSDPGLESFCWLAGGQIVYSRRESLYSNDENLWKIGIDGDAGTPIGKPKRITQWAGFSLENLSASADGKRLTLRKSTFQEQVYLGELAAGGTRLNPPRRLTNDEANDMPTAWTPDSRAVLFGSDRNGPWGIFKQEMNQDTAEPVVAGSQHNVASGRLSADGAWILYLEDPISPSTSLMRVPVSGGVPQLVVKTKGLPRFRCARAPANLCVLIESSPDEKQMTVTALDPMKGRGKVLRTIEKGPSGCALSPDGSSLAVTSSGEAQIHIGLFSLSGGPDREITLKGWPDALGLDWSSSSKGLYVGSVSPQNRTLLYLDLKGNARVLWQFKGRGTGRVWGVPSPDGRYLAILGSVNSSNVWMLEGF
jgi:Tol biopolymer transport system component